MRVYFAPCGIGLGHVGRSVPIARRLSEKNAEVIFSTYLEGVKYVERERLPLIEAPSIGFQIKLDGGVDFRQTAIDPGPFFASFTLLKQINAEVATIERFKPDVVVSDSRISPLIAARLLGIPRICILNQFQVIVPRRRHYLRLARFADFVTLALVGRMWTSGNTVLIPDFPQPYTVSAGNLTIPKPYSKNVRLIGPILPTRSRDLPSKAAIRNRLKLPVDKPVIFTPISGPTKEKAFLIGILRKILLNFPHDYEIVMSLGYPSSDEKPVRHGNLTIYNWVNDRFAILKACDLVVSRAGHGTITQCMCYGKPAVLVPTPGHTEQISNAKQAENIGVAKVVLQPRLSKEKLLEACRQLLRPEVTEKVEAIQAKVLGYDGLDKAVQIVHEMAGA